MLTSAAAAALLPPPLSRARAQQNQAGREDGQKRQGGGVTSGIGLLPNTEKELYQNYLPLIIYTIVITSIGSIIFRCWPNDVCAGCFSKTMPLQNHVFLLLTNNGSVFFLMLCCDPPKKSSSTFPKSLRSKQLVLQVDCI